MERYKQMKNRIAFLGDGKEENEGTVHFQGVHTDHTLCGDSLDHDDKTVGSHFFTDHKVNCKLCIQIVEFCKSIRKSEYKL